MTVHARLRGRNVGDGRRLDRGVTVSAIETKLADVEFVAVRDGLNRTIAHVRIPRRKVIPDARDCERRTEAAHHGGHERKLIPRGREDLCQCLHLRAGNPQIEARYYPRSRTWSSDPMRSLAALRRT